MSVQNTKSSLVTVNCGIPQGSILGPLLFLIYINDIGNVLPSKILKLYADDTNIFIFERDMESAVKIANEYMFILNTWFIANKLSLNTDKTTQKYDEPKIKIGNVMVAKTKQCKYLGVYIDEELKWTDHTEYVFSKLYKFIGVL